MALMDVSVILLMIFVSFTCAENSVPEAPLNGSITTTNAPSDTMPPNVNDSTKSTMPAAESPSTGNPSTETDTTATVPQPAAVTPPAPHCVRVKFDLEFNLTYTTIDNKASQVSYNISTDKDVPKNVSTTCDKKTQSWTNRWDNMFELTLTFRADNNSGYVLTNIDILNINVTDRVKDAKANRPVKLSYHSQGKILTPFGKSYSCDTREVLKFNSTRGKEPSNESVETVTVAISKVQLEAFRQNDKDEFGPSQGCKVVAESDGAKPGAVVSKVAESDGAKSGAVVITVVCSIIAFIVLAVIGYFIWYKRSQIRACFSARVHNSSK